MWRTSQNHDSVKVSTASFPATFDNRPHIAMLTSDLPTIVVETVNMEDVVRLDKIRYNTNNHYKEGERPADYYDVLMQTSTSKWIDQFKTYQSITLDLTKPNAKWMIDACRMGIHTGRFPTSFDDERDMYAAYITQQHPDIFDGREYFIRTETVSLKYGQHKAGPYTEMGKVLESLVTSIDGHTPIYDNTTELMLYFIPWEKLSIDREYRGFVCNNQLTALSQQHLYNLYHGEGIHRDAEIILLYFHQIMRERITFLSDYTFDIAILADDTPYFIEMNCFGTQYAAGSALFGWIEDHDVLYGVQQAQDHTLRVRYTTDQSDEA